MAVTKSAKKSKRSSCAGKSDKKCRRTRSARCIWTKSGKRDSHCKKSPKRNAPGKCAHASRADCKKNKKCNRIKRLTTKSGVTKKEHCRTSTRKSGGVRKSPVARRTPSARKTPSAARRALSKAIKTARKMAKSSFYRT